MMFKAAPLRHKVLIEELVSEQDSDGATVETWVSIGGLVSADIHPLSGREIIAAQAVESKVSTRITVRFRAEYKASMRVTHRATVYDVEAVIPDPDSGIKYATLLCSSGVNEG